MTTNLLKTIAVLAFGILSLTACEKAELVVPQTANTTLEPTGKKKPITDGDAIAVDPEVAAPAENPVITKNKIMAVHVGNEAIQELQLPAEQENGSAQGGANPENGKRRNRPSDEVKEGRYTPLSGTPATHNPAGPGRSNTEPK